jgi:Ca2+-binding RTX toxin-like protein
MAFDITTELTAEAQVTALYIGYFGRAPDPIGLTIWQSQLEEFLDGSSDGVPGRSLEDIATRFSQEKESKNEYSYFEKAYDGVEGNETLADAEGFINQVYLNIFGRPAEPGGLQNWTGHLMGGKMSVGEIILKIIEGAGPGDRERLENKIDAGLGLVAAAEAAGVTKYADVPGLGDLATTITDDVTRDASTLDAALTTIDSFFNAAPVATNDFVETNEDVVGGVAGDVSDNVTDADGDDLTFSVELGDGPANGSVVMNANGTFTYTPDQDFFGTDTFTYTVKDAFESDTATVTITVNAVNDAPVAIDGAASGTENASVISGAVTSTDVDGGAPSYSLEAGPSKGLVTVNPDGSFTFDPNGEFEALNAGQSENVTFEYAVADGRGGSDIGTVTITVNGVDDAPVAQDASRTATEANDASGVIAGQLVATDLDNDDAAIVFALNGTAPAGLTVNADGSYTFDPSVSAYNGLGEGDQQVISVGYTATSNGLTDVGVITITVSGSNDAPVATADDATTNEDTSVSGSVSATDVDDADGDLIYSVDANNGGATLGTVNMNPDGTYTYTPNANANGSDSFEYTVTDPSGAVSTATVSITINAVDDAPVAQDATRTATEANDASGVIAGQLVATDLDNDDAAIVFALNGTAPAGLTVNADGSYTFDPSVATYNGLGEGDQQIVSVGYTATSNGLADTGVITITVTGTSDAPVAQAFNVAGVEDNSVSGRATATDVDAGEVLTYTVAAGDGPSDGDVTMNPDGTFEYVPAANFSGTDSFTYTVTDGSGLTDTATITITVAATSEELSAGVDTFDGNGDVDDVIVGNENTLDAGDRIVGGDGDDKVVININSQEAVRFGGFEVDAESFQVTVDGSGGATFDMSGSEITGNTFINQNSTDDVVFNRVNMNPDPDVVDGTRLDVELNNVTDEANTTFTTRPAEVVGDQDVANVLVSNFDDNAHIGELNFYGTPDQQNDSGLETFNLRTEDNSLPVFLNDLNTPGDGADKTVTIVAEAELTIGDLENPGQQNAIAIDANDSDGGAGIVGFDNPLSADVVRVDASGSSVGVNFSVLDAKEGADVDGGEGDDIIVGSGADSMGSGGYNDTIDGNGGNDAIDGREGNDLITGGAGHDTLFGGDGSDTIYGNENDDIIFGQADGDVLFGGAGDDTIDTGSVSGGAAIEFVNAGADNDVVTTRGEYLTGRQSTFNVIGDRLDGGDGDDVLNVVTGNVSMGMDNADEDGLNDVQNFETINLNGGDQVYTIGNGSVFDNDSDTTVVVDGSDVGKTGTSSLDFDASTLSRAIELRGGDGDDSLIGGTGNDTISGDFDQGGNDGGVDTLRGGLGDDTFLFDAFEMNGEDVVDAGADNDTLVIQDRDGGGTSTLNGNVTGLETLEVEQNGTGNFTLEIDDSFNNGTGPRLHVDGSALTDDALIVEHQQIGSMDDEDIMITGGEGDDTFEMGAALDQGTAGNDADGDVIDGGEGFDTVVVSAAGIGDFGQVSNIECIIVRGASVDSMLVFGADAEAAFADGVTPRIKLENPGSVIIDTTAFSGPVIIEDDDNSNVFNTGGGDDTIIAAGGDDTFNTGAGADVIRVSGTDLDANDVLNAGADDDTVELDNSSGTVMAVSNLSTNQSVENYVLTSDGNTPVTSNNNSLEFVSDAGNNVDTQTTINVNAEALTDNDDTFTVTVDGSVQDDDFGFDVEGSEEDDTFVKNNDGVDNNINFRGNEGNDNFILNGADAGSTTIYDGGADKDTVSLSGGQILDDGFTSMSNIEVLTAVDGAAVDAALGFEADRAGIVELQGTAGDDNVLLDAVFNNDLLVNIGDADLFSDAGNDTINAGNSASTVTFEGFVEDFTADDHLTGGTGTGDVANIIVDGGATGDLSGMNGVETINLIGGFGGGGTLLLGDTSTDNPGGSLTITEDGFFGDTVNVEGAAFQGDITYVGENDSAVSNVETGDGDDTVDGGSLGDTLITNGGDDVVNGESGHDTIHAGAGEDTVTGGTGNDYLDGGTEDDVISGGDNNDTITGGMGEDTLDGGQGADTFRYVTASESAGILNDVILDFDPTVDTIAIELNALLQAGGVSATTLGGLTLAPVAGINATSFGQADGAISAGIQGDDVVNWVFQAEDGGDPPTLWIDLNDDGDISGQDLQITLNGVTGLNAGNVILVDTIAPEIGAVDLITDSAGSSSTDDITNVQNSTIRVNFVGDEDGVTDGTAAVVGDTVTLYVDGMVVDTAELDAMDVFNGFVDFTVDLGEDGVSDLDAKIEDAAGNSTETDESLTVTLDTDAPGLASIGVDTPVIASAMVSDADTGADSFEVTLTFDEEMNTSVSPNVLFEQDVSATLTSGSGSWDASGTVYTVVYDVLDNGEELDNISIGVDGAEDVAGNLMGEDLVTGEDAFDIDTLNPTVTDVTIDQGVDSGEDGGQIISEIDAGDTFSVSVTFSEAMDTGVAPQIDFEDGVGDPNIAGTLTESGSGSWDMTGTVFTQTYTISDDDIDIDDVRIMVSAGQDAAGNDQTEYTSTGVNGPNDDIFEIDTIAPTVTSVTVSDQLVADNDTTLTVTVNYSEEMDTTGTPMIGFSSGASDVLSASGSGSWNMDGTVFTQTYSVDADNPSGGADIEDITVTVSGATDLVGNVQDEISGGEDDAFTSGPTDTNTDLGEDGDGNAPGATGGSDGVFDIDTQNPTVTSVTISDQLITDADDGSTFTVIVTYSEEMDVTDTPSISFSSGGSTMTSGSGSWSSGGTVFTQTYTVSDQGVDIQDVLITVSGGSDIAGNEQVSYTSSGEDGANDDIFDIDTLNPVPTFASGAGAATTPAAGATYNNVTDTLVLTFSAGVENPLGTTYSGDNMVDIDLSKLVWDIDGEDDTNPAVVFGDDADNNTPDLNGGDVDYVINSDGTITVTLNNVAAAALEGATGFAGSVEDEIVINSGFVTDIHGNESENTDVTNIALNLTGTDNPDNMFGGSLNDTINGGLSADTITGGAGADVLTGGDGDDTFVFADAAEFEEDTIIDGGVGTDTIQVLGTTLDDASFDTVFNMESIDFSGASAHSLTLGANADTAFENGIIVTTNASATSLTVDGSNFTQAMDVTGTNNADTITGGDGNDTITGGAGSDGLTGGAGADTFVFADTAVNNGVDILADLNGTTDLLDFSAFFGSTTPTLQGGIGSSVSNGGDVIGNINGLVHFLYSGAADSSADVNQASEIAAAIGTGFTAGGKAVVLSGEDTSANNTAYIWFVEDTSGNGVIDTSEVSLVGTMATFDVNTITNVLT